VGRFRFALVFDGARLEHWHLRCLAELESVAQLSWAIAAPGPPTRRSSRFLGRYVRRVERKALVPVGDRFADVPSSPESDDAVDFVLGLGNVDVPPGLARAARLGVWRFAHELDGSSPPFLAEVGRGETATRAALLQIAGPEGRRSTIASGVFRTDTRSYARSRASIVDAIAPWPARACRLFSEGPIELPAEAPAAPAKDVASLARLATGFATRRLALAWERLFRHPQWNVGVLERPIEALLAPDAYTGEDVEWFPLEGRDGFLADPFAVERGEQLHIVCEYFDYERSLGRIRELEHSGEGFGPLLRNALSVPMHISYPFLLDLPEGLHCVPETADAGEVALYRVNEAPDTWTKVAVLLEDVPGVDPTLFRHDGRWWLTCTRKGPQEDAELWVWHAPSVQGPWVPHALNPVKTDARGARPAGPPFLHEGVLYRPAQDCSRTYGGRITVHRVHELTPTSFAEEQVAVLEASPRSAYPCGPHTVTAVGRRVLVDGRRAVFAPAAFRAFLRIWARDVGRSLRRR
jgi:hypothetical protein